MDRLVFRLLNRKIICFNGDTQNRRARDVELRRIARSSRFKVMVILGVICPCLILNDKYNMPQSVERCLKKKRRKKKPFGSSRSILA